jgi:hypothetical protein
VTFPLVDGITHGFCIPFHPVPTKIHQLASYIAPFNRIFFLG